jgi:beta-N-acetylhexosaminidase
MLHHTRFLATTLLLKLLLACLACQGLENEKEAQAVPELLLQGTGPTENRHGAGRNGSSRGGAGHQTGGLADATLSQKIGRTIVVGFDGISEADDGVKSIAQLLREEKIGGVILYGRNVQSPSQLTGLTAYLRSANSGAMVLVDQEGGAVQRLNEKNGFSRRYPKAIEMASWSDEVVRREYGAMAMELSQYGITDNLAPVVDLNVNPLSPAIGQFGRSFSSDPNVVARLARIFIDAHKAAHVRTYLKHFPGHGSARADSHLGFTDVTHTWGENELVPYRLLIASGHASAIMTAHVYHARVDPQFPATLSKKWIKEKLRQELRFDGVVITDDLHMKAVTTQWSPEHAALLAMQAGCDILLFSNSQKTVRMDASAIQHLTASIIAAVQRGNDELGEHLQASYDRIMRFRK